VTFLVEHHEELEADLLPEHDLLDVWRGRMSFRRLELLIKHLPPDGAVVRALNPEAAAAASWPPEAYVLADYYDLYAHAKFKNPKRYPRPADAVRERERAEARHAALERQAQRLSGKAVTRG
jgi:hypothetical protein